MIGSLRGRLAVKAPPQLLLEVGGVGYELEAPMSTFYGLPAIGEDVRLLTHLVVREDAHVLYGFASEAERQLFRSLLKVTGVGPKMALGILSGTSVEDSPPVSPCRMRPRSRAFRVSVARRPSD